MISTLLERNHSAAQSVLRWDYNTEAHGQHSPRQRTYFAVHKHWARFSRSVGEILSSTPCFANKRIIYAQSIVSELFSIKTSDLRSSGHHPRQLHSCVLNLREMSTGESEETCHLLEGELTEGVCYLCMLCSLCVLGFVDYLAQILLLVVALIGLWYKRSGSNCRLELVER